jgi:hypothetical protein
MSIPQRSVYPSLRRGWPLVWLCVALALTAPRDVARAQTATPAPATGTTSSRPDALWQCTLPGGVYLVALRSIASVSSHEYVVDGAARVTEVTVATNSMVEARFYYLEPVSPSDSASVPGVSTALDTAQQHVSDAATSQGGSDPVWMKVVKNYPTTTHAHTVEYRLTTKENLQQLYQSLAQSWTTGKGANLTTE